MKLSIAIITKNEEDRLPDCLKSVAFADDILVVDSGSEDRTVQVARSSGARVLSESWRGYSGQKQFAVDQCRHDWVLILDADERVPEETALEIREVMRHKEGTFDAFSFRRKNYLHGRWIRHCGWWPDRIVRLVNRRRGRFDGRPVHEKWVPEGNVMALDAVIEHISFRKFSDLVSKMETYSNLSALELSGGKPRVNAWTPLSHGIWMFLKTYFFELGLLDGFDGMVISVMNAGGSFLKYAKLREMIEKRKSNHENTK
ncbi:MAG: glycosyltransferase family 2 protein [Deltaproteobacteria bacterium]|nr:glycosyltransferase family 2 protein [Deltaproteobacteria bacterium]